MSQALYERYKDALRRGHVATLRGRHDAALAAYVEAATIAPERALPHASIGTVYLRLERPAEALTAFGHALDRSPGDEAALAGRADALVALGRPAEAADTLDRLSATQDAAGLAVEALDSARRALELAESRPRRRAVETLVDQLQASASDAPGREALERAVRLLERTAVALPEPPAPLSSPGQPTAGPGRSGTTPGDAADAFESGAQPLEPGPGPLALVVEAEAAVDAGDAETGRAQLLRAAGLFEHEGRRDAALDACYQALSLAPSDPDLHLALAGLYLDRGWRTLAAEKLALLGRMAALAGDAVTVDRARELARARLAEEPRVRDLIA